MRALALILATACAPPGRDRETVTVTPRVELDVPASVRQGDIVPVVIRVTNPGERRIEVYFLGRTIAFDIVVSRADGETVWRRLAGATVEQILQIRTLAPGESLELRDSWRASAPPGAYRVQGLIPTDRPEPLRTPVVPLEIVPP